MARIVGRQSRWLALRGHRVRVVTTAAAPGGWPTGSDRYVEHLCLPISKIGPLPGTAPFTVARWGQIIRDAWPEILAGGRPDAVHGHAEAELPLIAAGLIGPRSRIGVVSSLYGSVLAGVLDHVRIRGRPGPRGYLAALRGAAGVLPSARAARWLRRSEAIALSHRHATMARLSYGLPGIQVVPPGVDTLLYHPAAPEVRAGLRARFGLAGGGFVWAVVGRLAAGKGVDVAIRAITRLENDRLLVAGSGPEAQRLAEAAAALGDRVVLAGDVNPPAAAYMAADGVLFPTAHEESFGLAALEAMACGRAVLATRRGALPEVLGSAGLLLHGRDPRDWAEAMAALRREPTRRQAMEASGRDRAVSLYSRGRTTTALEAAYARAMAASS
jgi:glycosyltransferase involved in cell wall biosynthesis